MRKTKIVATIGPACQDPKILTSLILAGADMLRINASHSTPAGIKQWARRIRHAEKMSGKHVAILVDLQGPRVRTGKLEGGKPVLLKQGESAVIRMTSRPGSAAEISTLCMEFPQMVKARDRILLDNGMMELEVLSVRRDRIECRVISGGVLGENKGINLPNAPVTLPALSRKDHQDLQAAVDAGVDYIALSFVRSEQDVLAAKNWLKKKGKVIPVIAKIEKPKAVDHLEKIIKAADGIMVARGDLGIELGVEKVPAIQKKIISHANRHQVPVITATQMLESMIDHARPTRAEVSDVANAVYDSTDAVMLSGETSIGKHPVKVVQMMATIVRESERSLGESTAAVPIQHSHISTDLFINAIVHAARHAAKDLGAKAIAVFTRSGKTAALISKFRPVSPVIALVHSLSACRRLALFRGVVPVLIRQWKSTDAMIRECDKAIAGLGLVRRGDPIVILSGRQALPAARYMTKIHLVGDNENLN